MRKIYIPFLCCTAVLLGACSDEETFHPDYQLTIEADTTMAVTVSDATPIRPLMALDRVMPGIWSM